MSYAFNIPGYVQGHRFLDDAIYYDAASKRFKDLAGFDHLGNGLTITAGSPVFETVGSNRGIRLNNTFHGSFRSAIPWMGSVVLAIKPTYVSGSTITRYPLLFGDAVTASSNGAIQVSHFSSQRTVRLSIAGAVLQSSQTRNDNNLVVVAFSTDQETRKSYGTSDGITVTEATAPASTTNGNAVGLSAGLSGVRFGNMNAVAGDLTEVTDFYCGIYEQHFFSTNIVLNHLAETKAFIDTLKKRYGVA